MSRLRDAIAKARGDSSENIPASIHFLNRMRHRLANVHNHTCCDCTVEFGCVEEDPALCHVACIRCREANGLDNV